MTEDSSMSGAADKFSSSLIQKKTGLYIHIPFCVRKCNYCAFLSFDAETSPRKEYVEALIGEIGLRGKETAKCDRESGSETVVDTVYIGGGTPSVLDVSQLSLIMEAVRSSFTVCPDAEITIEANPGTLGRLDSVALTKLRAYRCMGVNRLSMGVQSMQNDRLRFLGRIHTAEDVVRDVRLAGQAGFDNISLDLIFSVPGETAEDALRDAKSIMELGPEHISCYSLQLEEGTPFYEMAEKGELREVDDEEDRKTYHELCDLLRGSGYDHYEISNFARCETPGLAPGFDESSGSESEPSSDKITAGAASPYRSRHNSRYWNMSDYIGLGLGASGFVNGVRYRNTADMDEYLRFFATNRDICDDDIAGAESSKYTGDTEDHDRTEGVGIAKAAGSRIPLFEEHVNDSFDNISEAVFTGLRRREGITYEEAVRAYRRGTEKAADTYRRDADQPSCTYDLAKNSRDDLYSGEFWRIYADVREEAEDFSRRGLLIIDERGLRLTSKGIDISNKVMALFV